MKDAILDVAKQRNNDVARRIKLLLAFVSDLPSADCEYHELCYNRLMKIPKYNFQLVVYMTGDKPRRRHTLLHA